MNRRRLRSRSNRSRCKTSMIAFFNIRIPSIGILKEFCSVRVPFLTSSQRIPSLWGHCLRHAAWRKKLPLPPQTRPQSGLPPGHLHPPAQPTYARYPILFHSSFRYRYASCSKSGGLLSKRKGRNFLI